VADFTIDELTIPSAPGEPGWDDFVAATRVRNAVEAASIGSDDLNYDAEELLPNWQPNEFEVQRMFVARSADDIVARATFSSSTADGENMADIHVEVLPTFRRRGIGSALLDHMDECARELGRSVLQGYGLDAAENLVGATIVPPTGFGAVPAESELSRFLVGNEFVLEQVYRYSRLALPHDEQALLRLRDEARVAANDYRIEQWHGHTPERFLEAMVVLRKGMQTDAPTAELEPDRSEWTVQRVMEEDAELMDLSPRTYHYLMAVHNDTSEVAGFTEFSTPHERTRPASQGDTLVLKAHRGHRLGMLLKAEGLLRLQRENPGHPAITTSNAEENRPMLSVNEALGFIPVGYEGGWKKVRAT
jgi:GNAT superfamily N-acetyltransferase